MNFIGTFRLYFLLASLVWVMVGIEALVPIGAAVPILKAIAVPPYAAF